MKWICLFILFLTPFTNPRACCGTLTKTFDVACAVNDDNTLGNDVHYKFKLEKYCDVWPTLTVNSTGTDFAYTSTLRYKNQFNIWIEIPSSSSITRTHQNFDDRGDLPIGNQVEFELVLDANNANAIGNFELQITAVKQLSRIENGNTIACAGDFNSCCRIAVDFEDTASSPIAQSHHLGNSLDIRLYPNPAKGTVNWEMKNLGDELVSIELYSVLGKQLRKLTTKEIVGSMDLKGIPSGVCTVRIRNQHMTKMVKLVVE